MDDETPREMTPEECRTALLEQIAVNVRYWLHEPRAATVREKLNGLAFSILVIIDGESALPGFELIPSPHEDDKEYHRENGDNWWPDDVDISGDLHEHWHKFEAK